MLVNLRQKTVDYACPTVDDGLDIDAFVVELFQTIVELADHPLERGQGLFRWQGEGSDQGTLIEQCFDRISAVDRSRVWLHISSP
jgi:hypothetical protein